jgi:hypothetical protein
MTAPMRSWQQAAGPGEQSGRPPGGRSPRHSAGRGGRTTRPSALATEGLWAAAVGDDQPVPPDRESALRAVANWPAGISGTELLDAIQALHDSLPAGYDARALSEHDVIAIVVSDGEGSHSAATAAARTSRRLADHQDQLDARHGASQLGQPHWGQKRPCRIFPLATGSPRHGNDAQTLRFCVTSCERRTRLTRAGHSRCRARTRGAGAAHGPRTPRRPPGRGSPCAAHRALVSARRGLRGSRHRQRPARHAARPATRRPGRSCCAADTADIAAVHRPRGDRTPPPCRCHRAAPHGGVTRDRAAVRATCAAARAWNRSSLIVPLARSAGQPAGGCQVRPFFRVRGPGLLLFPQQLGEARPANPGMGIAGGARSRAHARCGPTGTGTAPEEAS